MRHRNNIPQRRLTRALSALGILQGERSCTVITLGMPPQ
jgi:hypothetical protein